MRRAASAPGQPWWMALQRNEDEDDDGDYDDDDDDLPVNDGGEAAGGASLGGVAVLAEEKEIPRPHVVVGEDGGQAQSLVRPAVELKRRAMGSKHLEHEIKSHLCCLVSRIGGSDKVNVGFREEIRPLLPCRIQKPDCRLLPPSRYTYVY